MAQPLSTLFIVYFHYTDLSFGVGLIKAAGPADVERQIREAEVMKQCQIIVIFRLDGKIEKGESEEMSSYIQCQICKGIASSPESALQFGWIFNNHMWVCWFCIQPDERPLQVRLSSLTNLTVLEKLAAGDDAE